MLKLLGGWMPFVIATIALVVGFSLQYVSLSDRESLVILHFVSGRGADELGKPGSVLQMLGTGAFVVISAALMKAALHRRNAGMADMAGYMAATGALLILIAILGIISVN